MNSVLPQNSNVTIRQVQYRDLEAIEQLCATSFEAEQTVAVKAEHPYLLRGLYGLRKCLSLFPHPFQHRLCTYVAEQERQAAKARAEERRKAAEAERMRNMEEILRAAMEREKRENLRKERVRQAEERSRETARRAREQQEQAAKERLRRQKEKEAERRSEEAARKARAEREQAAQERLKAILIEEKQEASRQRWAKMREAADRREAAKRQQARTKKIHPQYTWRERHCIGIRFFLSLGLLYLYLFGKNTYKH